MKVQVDLTRCQSNALCMDLAPEVFEVGEDNVLVILNEHPAEGLRDKLEIAVRRCPTHAISIGNE